MPGTKRAVGAGKGLSPRGRYCPVSGEVERWGACARHVSEVRDTAMFELMSIL